MTNENDGMRRCITISQTVIRDKLVASLVRLAASCLFYNAEIGELPHFVICFTQNCCVIGMLHSHRGSGNLSGIEPNKV